MIFDSLIFIVLLSTDEQKERLFMEMDQVKEFIIIDFIIYT